MTLVHVDLRDPGTPTDTGALGSLLCAPTRRRTEGTATILPAPFGVALTGLTADITLAPTGADWCWCIREVTPAGAVRFVAVPDVPEADYNALVDVDPTSLRPPITDVPMWQAAVDAVNAALTASGQISQDAAASATAAQEARDGAESARDAAQGWMTGASQAAAASQVSADAAHTSEVNAGSSAATAAQSAADAEAARDQVAGFTIDPDDPLVLNVVARTPPTP